MWEYKIAKTEVGYSIYKKKEKDGMVFLQWLASGERWVLSKTLAKTFYNEETAISALTLAKFKGERLETDTASENERNCTGKQEKKSWSEF